MPAFSLGAPRGLPLLRGDVLADVPHAVPARARPAASPRARSGSCSSAVPVALSGSSPLAGWIADRFGSARAASPSLGMLVLAGALFTLSPRAAPTRASPRSRRTSFVAGVGMGLFQAPNNAAVMSALPRARLGSGGGLLATARNAGMAAGVAIAGALFALRAGAGRVRTGVPRGLRARAPRGRRPRRARRRGVARADRGAARRAAVTPPCSAARPVAPGSPRAGCWTGVQGLLRCAA